MQAPIQRSKVPVHHPLAELALLGRILLSRQELRCLNALIVLLVRIQQRKALPHLQLV